MLRRKCQRSRICKPLPAPADGIIFEWFSRFRNEAIFSSMIGYSSIFLIRHFVGSCHHSLVVGGIYFAIGYRSNLHSVID